MVIQIGDFEKWNEEQMVKHPPEGYYSHSSFIIRWIEKKRIGKIVKLADAKSGEKILEIGCGQGHILEKIRQGELYGLDLSDKMLTDAAVRLKGRAKLLRQNAESFAGHFQGIKFNKIICSEVLEHTLYPEKVIAEAAKVLKGDGVFVVSIPNERLINFAKKFLIKIGIFRLFFKDIPEDTTQVFHLHSFSLAMLRGMIEGKFKVEKAIGIPFSFFPLRYIVKLTHLSF